MVLRSVTVPFEQEIQNGRQNIAYIFSVIEFDCLFGVELFALLYLSSSPTWTPKRVVLIASCQTGLGEFHGFTDHSEDDSFGHHL